MVGVPCVHGPSRHEPDTVACPAICHAADGRRGRWSLVGWMFNPTEQPWLLGTGSTSARPDPMPRLRAADPPGLRHLGRPRRRRAPHPTPPAAAAPANLTARTHRSSLGPPHGHLGRAVGRPDDNQAEPRGQHRRQAALQPVRDLVFGLMQPGRSSALPTRSARARAAASTSSPGGPRW